MTLSVKICQALARALEASGVDSTVQDSFTITNNETYVSRVVCIPSSATQRKTIRGVYDVSGEIITLTSVDADNAIANHLRLCDSIRDLVGDTEACSANIMAQDSTIHIYNRSWHLDEMEDDAGNRGFKATFSWRAVARDTLNNN